MCISIHEQSFTEQKEHATIRAGVCLTYINPLHLIAAMTHKLLFLTAIHLGLSTAMCPANEILLRNSTCHCPFFKFNGLCLRHRYQTTINATIDSVLTH